MLLAPQVLIPFRYTSSAAEKKIPPKALEKIMTQRGGGGANGEVIAALEGLIGKNPSLEGLITIFKQIEKCLHGITTTTGSSTSSVDVLQNWNFIRDLRRLLGIVALKIIQKDVIQAEQHNVDYRLWMRGYYDVFHVIRYKLKSKSAHGKEVKVYMQDIFKNGKRIFKDIISIYEGMLCKEKSLASRTQGVGSVKMLAIVSSMYKVYTYMGDIHRYESLVESKKQLNEDAIRYYDQAIRLMPDRYRAYHNLAIVHKSQNDLVATVYNFIRGQCLEGGESSRQELLELFDDLSKHYRRHEDTFWHHQCRKNQKCEGRQVHKTYWVTTDESARGLLPPGFDHPQFMDEHLGAMDDRELYKKFAQAYCVFLGTIYTKIGLESLELLAEDALVYFQELLRRKSEFLPTLRIVQITAAIIFMIHFIGVKHKARNELDWGIAANKKLKAHAPPDWKIGGADKPVPAVDDAQHMENVAMDFALEMFSLLAEYLSDALRLCDWTNPLLTPVSAGLQLWEGWLRNNSSLWAFTSRKRPVFSIRRLMRSKMENTLDKTDDVWTALAELMNQVEVVVFEFPYLFPRCKKVRSSKYPIPIGKLPEYSALTGFYIFASNALMNIEFFFTPENAQPEKAFLFVRLVSLCEFGDQLATKVKILEKVGGWNNRVNQYKSIAVAVQWDKESKDSCGLREVDYQYVVAKSSENLRLSHELKLGRKLRRSRSKDMALGDCNNGRCINKFNSNSVSSPQTPMKREPKRARMPNYELWILMAEYGYPTELVVCPKRVVLDTNCLIRDLPIIESLMPHLRHPLYLPVTVILELRGLSKGGLTNKQKLIYGSVNNPEAKDAVAKNEIVAEQCKLALKYIEYRMSSFRIITSTGTFLRPRNLYVHLQDDYFNPEDSNDERILDSCKFLEYADLEARKMDTPTRVVRNTVLLTGDQILSARTITLDIPTRRTGSFAQWFFNTHTIKLNLRYLWGVDYNPEEGYGLRYLTRDVLEGDEEEEEEDDRHGEIHGLPASQFVVLVKARNRKRKKNQIKGRVVVVELNPQRFVL